MLPPKCYIGTTIETNRVAPGHAPAPQLRANGLWSCKQIAGAVTFLTIEPVLDFDVLDMLGLIFVACPSFINIGADSKGCGLVEPSAAKVTALIEGIRGLGIEIRQKKNLDRILNS